MKHFDALKNLAHEHLPSVDFREAEQAKARAQEAWGISEAKRIERLAVLKEWEGLVGGLAPLQARVAELQSRIELKRANLEKARADFLCSAGICGDHYGASPAAWRDHAESAVQLQSLLPLYEEGLTLARQSVAAHVAKMRDFATAHTLPAETLDLLIS